MFHQKFGWEQVMAAGQVGGTCPPPRQGCSVQEVRTGKVWVKPLPPAEQLAGRCQQLPVCRVSCVPPSGAERWLLPLPVILSLPS